jgi:hypothetical protein
MRVLKSLLPALAAAWLCGCAHYHLGPVMEDTPNKSVEVLPFNNQTLQPRLGDAVTQALRERLQTDATYHLATHKDGDIVVTGVIRQYQRIGLGYDSTDAVTPENYRIQVIVHVTAREHDSGKLLLDKDVKGETLVNIGADLASAERQALPLVSVELARNITELLTEGAW